MSNPRASGRSSNLLNSLGLASTSLTSSSIDTTCLVNAMLCLGVRLLLDICEAVPCHDGDAQDAAYAAEDKGYNAACGEAVHQLSVMTSDTKAELQQGENSPGR
jgi:hypothetical protein